MHEMAITESVVDSVSERIGPERVVARRARDRPALGVVPDALRFCFEICAKGTTLDGAELEIREIAGRVPLRDVRRDVALDFPVGSARADRPGSRSSRAASCGSKRWRLPAVCATVDVGRRPWHTITTTTTITTHSHDHPPTTTTTIITITTTTREPRAQPRAGDPGQERPARCRATAAGSRVAASPR
jgi:hydrogenase nickel incorporation protein HypA/HybF